VPLAASDFSTRVANFFIELINLALWYFPVLMVLSGISMVIYDSRIVQRYFAKIKNKLWRRRYQSQIELGDISPPADSRAQETEPESLHVPENVRVDPDENIQTAKEIGPLQSTRTEQAKVEALTVARSPTHAIRAEDVRAPYSIWVGLILLCFFLVSFIAIMVVRGVVTDLPLDFRFFANIYLAGSQFNGVR
jgi:hypothetical protein